MRWTAVSISEMTIAYRPARTVSDRYDNASRYASHCYLDNVSMGKLADTIFFTRCEANC